MRGPSLALVALMVLSGCAGGSDDGTDPDGTGPGGTGPGPGTSRSGAPPPGGVGTITVTLERTDPDGPIPLRVNFTLDATFRQADGKPGSKAGATVLVTYRQTEDANGTAVSEAAEVGPTIASLPTTFSLSFEEAGKFEVVASVKASGYQDGRATMLILPRVPGSGDPSGGEPIFFDGAEGDTSQWTLSAKVVLIDFNGIVPVQETPVDHPDGPWVISDAEARTGTHSWFSTYPDNYRGRMVSLAIPVPEGGGKLTFYYKGGAESNGFDGLFVYANGQEIVPNTAAVAASWTRIQASVPGGDVELEFRFDSDPSCSNASGAPAGCGEGWDSGGIYIDDITVA
jgi:hypothetical protein